jgi:hypothetical protein
MGIMEDNNTTQSNIEKAEAVSNILQFVVNAVAKQYGGVTGQSFSNFLPGKGGLVVSFPRLSSMGMHITK